MAFRDLHEFADFLERNGQLRRVSVPVSNELEITEITDRVSKAGGPALLFEDVVGYNMPVIINMFGSYQRTSWALNVPSLDALSQRISNLLQADLPASLTGKMGKLFELSELARFRPKIVRSGRCQEVVEDTSPSIKDLPILKCWPLDGGQYVTLPLVVTRDPVSGRRNVGMYRMQVYDERTLGMHWHMHKDAAEHYSHSEGAGKRLEVAVALGSDPATIYAATAPLPSEIDEFLFAGWLRRKSVELVKCRTVDLEVPAHSEIVLEGYVDPAERRLEGPFGDHTGYYSLPDNYPVFHLTCVTMRRNPIYPATIVGKPPMEDAYLGKATERLFLPLVKMILPEVVDINMPVEGVFHNLVIVSIRKRFPGQARRVMNGLWGMGQLMFAKAIVVVDDDVDVQDTSAVVWRASNNVDPRRDLLVVDGPLDALDHSSPLPGFGSKIGIDATRKWPAEGHNREWPPDIEMSDEIRRIVDERWAEYGL